MSTVFKIIIVQRGQVKKPRGLVKLVKYVKFIELRSVRNVHHHCEGRDTVSTVSKIIIEQRGQVKEPREFVIVFSIK